MNKLFQKTLKNTIKPEKKFNFNPKAFNFSSLIVASTNFKKIVGSDFTLNNRLSIHKRDMICPNFPQIKESSESEKGNPEVTRSDRFAQPYFEKLRSFVEDRYASKGDLNTPYTLERFTTKKFLEKAIKEDPKNLENPFVQEVFFRCLFSEFFRDKNYPFNSIVPKDSVINDILGNSFYAQIFEKIVSDDALKLKAFEKFESLTSSIPSEENKTIMDKTLAEIKNKFEIKNFALKFQILLDSNHWGDVEKRAVMNVLQELQDKILKNG